MKKYIRLKLSCVVFIFSCLSGPVMAAMTYYESETLETGWYSVNLSSGSLSKEPVSSSLNEGAAISGPAQGVPYLSVDWIGIGRTNLFPSGPRGVYLNPAGQMVEVYFTGGTSKAYGATQTVGGVVFSDIDWVGTVNMSTGSVNSEYGAYLNASGSFVYVDLNTGTTLSLASTQTQSGISFGAINWLGVYGARPSGANPISVPEDIFHGVYQNEQGIFVSVDLRDGSETFYGNGTIAAGTLANQSGLAGMSLLDLPLLEVSDGGAGPRATFYVVHVPEPSMSVLMGLGGLMALRRRRNK